MSTVAFTGHRPNKLKGYEAKANKKLLWELHRVIVDHIVNKGVTTFINGVALGVDMWAAQIVIKLKEEYPHIKLISAVPCLHHSSKWPKKSQDEWQYVIDNSDEVTIVTAEPYQPYMMQVRNVWMIDKCDCVIAVWDGTKGGTANCVRAAEERYREITIINPKEF